MTEAICRRLQLVEYQYRERIRDGSSGAGGHRVTGANAALTGLAVMGGEEADLFDGLKKSAGGACVAPALSSYIADELAKKAAVDKAARKAREEKALVRAGVQDLPTSPLVPPEHDKGAGKEVKKKR